MNRLAALQQFLEQYDRKGMGGQGGGYNIGFDPYGVLDFANKMNGENRAGARMSWAQQMAGPADDGGGAEPPPDFFGGDDQPRNALAAFRRPDPVGTPMSAPPRAARRPPNMLAYLGGR